jgi:D-erythrulose 4-kinase
MLETLGQALGDDARVDAAAVAAGVAQARETLMDFGKAQVGDKTMVDAVVPFADDLSDGVDKGGSLREAWQHATDVAEQAGRKTADLAAKLGRARSHGDKSKGTPDPGAVSFALVCRTVGEELERTAADGGTR